MAQRNAKNVILNEIRYAKGSKMANYCTFRASMPFDMDNP